MTASVATYCVAEVKDGLDKDYVPTIIVVDILQEFDCVCWCEAGVAYECQDENEG